jgi:hypothetical protein
MFSFYVNKDIIKKKFLLAPRETFTTQDKNMTEIAQKYQDELERIKKNIENSYNRFKENYKNFNRTMSYLFKTQ